jgi:hypothetical protein
MTNRKQWATHLVEHLQAYCDNKSPGTLEVHWDDCDCDDRNFWFHFRAPGLAKVRQAKSELMRMTSKLVRECWHETDRFFAAEELPYDWTMTHSRWDSPQAKYRTFDGRKEFDCYDGETWIKVLSFYG